MTRYLIIDDCGSLEYFHAESDDDAREYAVNWMEHADFDASEGTLWYDASLHRVELEKTEEDREKTVWLETLTRTINPDEPDCEGDHDHEWCSPYSVLGGVAENPGVWGHGGGIIIKEVCTHCGRYKITDTWAQRSDTGEQGLTSTEYRDADDDSRAWLWRQLANAAEEIDLTEGYSIQRDDDEQRLRVVRDDDDEQKQIVCSDDELREVVERQSWDLIIEQFPESGGE